MLQFLDLLKAEIKFSSCLVFFFNAPMVFSIVKFKVCDKNFKLLKIPYYYVIVVFLSSHLDSFFSSSLNKNRIFLANHFFKNFPQLAPRWEVFCDRHCF